MPRQQPDAAVVGTRTTETWVDEVLITGFNSGCTEFSGITGAPVLPTALVHPIQLPAQTAPQYRDIVDS